MTKVSLSYDGARCRISAKGHAEGSPAMCAAISTLIYTAAGWARSAGVSFAEQLLSGDAVLEFGDDADCIPVFELLCVGFLQLQKHDPHHVSVDISFFKEDTHERQ